jgi:hypothetical protein
MFPRYLERTRSGPRENCRVRAADRSSGAALRAYSLANSSESSSPPSSKSDDQGDGDDDNLAGGEDGAADADDGDRRDSGAAPRRAEGATKAAHVVVAVVVAIDAAAATAPSQPPIEALMGPSRGQAERERAWGRRGLAKDRVNSSSIMHHLDTS